MEALLWQERALSLLDQGKYPAEEHWYDCKDYRAVLEAFRAPGAVQGEAVISVAGAYAYCLAALELEGSLAFHKELGEVKAQFLALRPDSTALRAAFARLERAYEEYKDSDQVITALLACAVTIHREDVIASRTMGREGRDILPEEAKVILSSGGGLFHTGAPGGTIGVLRSAALQKKLGQVFVCENRPAMQGRAIARELAAAQIPCTLVPDHAAAALMPRHFCNIVLIEGIRAAANGDLVAGVGAYELAIAAYFHSLPVYATLPLSQYSSNIPNGDAIPPADMSTLDLAGFSGRAQLPEGVSVWSPQYEVVPQYLLTGLITNKGLIFPPYEETISEALLKDPNKPVLFL